MVLASFDAYKASLSKSRDSNLSLSNFFSPCLNTSIVFLPSVSSTQWPKKLPIMSSFSLVLLMVLVMPNACKRFVNISFKSFSLRGGGGGGGGNRLKQVSAIFNIVINI